MAHEATGVEGGKGVAGRRQQRQEEGRRRRENDTGKGGEGKGQCFGFRGELRR